MDVPARASRGEAPGPRGTQQSDDAAERPGRPEHRTAAVGGRLGGGGCARRDGLGRGLRRYL